MSTQNSLTDVSRATRPGALLSGEMFTRLVQLRPALLSLALCGAATLILFLAAIATIRPPGELDDFGVSTALLTSLVLIAALGLVPVVHLLRYAGTIGNADAMRSSASIEAVLRRQLRLWRFIGLASIVWGFLFVIGVITAVLEVMD